MMEEIILLIWVLFTGLGVLTAILRINLLKHQIDNLEKKLEYWVINKES